MKQVILAVLLWAVAQSVHAACRDDLVKIKGDWGQAAFVVEVAESPAERNKGLMFRESMGRREGMLFVFERPQRVAFWMKNTLIPLDMIFTDSQGVVQNIHHNAIPGDLTTIPGGDSVQYVLEINGGLAARYGFSTGDVLQHPKISQTGGKWAC